MLSSTSARHGVRTLYQRDIPQNIRGLMMALLEATGVLGIALFAFVAGYLFDKIGPSSPFNMVAIVDFIFVLAILIVILWGRFNV